MKRILPVIVGVGIGFVIGTGSLFAAETDVPIDSNTFPDSCFMNYVHENFDKNDDWYLSSEEIAAVTEINVGCTIKGTGKNTFITIDRNFDKRSAIDRSNGSSVASGLATDSVNLKGIEIFENLEVLNCDRLVGVGVTKKVILDVSNNTKLKTLICSCNGINSLDISNLTNLTTVNLRQNNLTSLDVSKAKNLVTLDCSNNGLTKLDVSNNVKLKNLDCAFNKLVELDVRNCTELDSNKFFYRYQKEPLANSYFDRLIEDTSFTGLFKFNGQWRGFISGYAYKEYLEDEHGYQYAKYQPDKDEVLFQKMNSTDKTLYYVKTGKFDGNKNGVVSVTAIYKDGKLQTAKNGVICVIKDGICVEFDHSHQFVDGKCSCGSILSDLVPIDKDVFPDSCFREYVHARIDKNKDMYLSEEEIAAVKEIDVSCRIYDSYDGEHEEVVNSYFEGCNREYITFKGIELFENLEVFDCSNFVEINATARVELDLSKNTKLKALRCNGNNLSELNTGDFADLTTLECSNNNLTSLDLRKSTNLAYLYCYRNKLTSLNLDNNTKLITLDCTFNRITSLNLSKHTSLNKLSCVANKLSGLDVRGCTSLNKTSNLYYRYTYEYDYFEGSYYSPDMSFTGVFEYNGVMTGYVHGCAYGETLYGGYSSFNDCCYYGNSMHNCLLPKVNGNDDTLYYVRDGVWASTANGYLQIDYMYKDGEVIPYNKGVIVKNGICTELDHTHKMVNGVCYCGYTDDGLRKVNGVWGYYLKGVLQTSRTGIVQKADHSDNNWYFVKNGIYTKASGIAQKADKSSSTWYYVKDGIYTKATGIAQKADKSSTTWFFVKNGVYTKATGISQKADKSSTTWYYVANGVYSKATGIAKKADGSSNLWYFVKNGVYIKSTGIAKKADGSSITWFYVKNGVYTKANGIAKKADGTSDTWFYVYDGIYTNKTCVAKRADGLYPTYTYYVKSGIWQNTYSGKVKIGTKTYTIKNGIVK